MSERDKIFSFSAYVRY